MSFTMYMQRMLEGLVSEFTLKQEFTMYARMFFSSFDSRSAV